MSRTAPPRRGESSAPKFDSSKPYSLSRYFEDIEELASECNGDDAWKKKKLLYYGDAEDAEIWESIPGLANATTWDQVKGHIKRYYPSLNSSSRHTYAELETLVEETARLGITTRDKFSEYERNFLVKSEYLKRNNKISDLDSKRLFHKGISGRLSEMLQDRLRIKEPDHEEGIPYDIDIVSRNALFLLGGSTFSNPGNAATPSTSSSTSAENIPIKQEANSFAKFEERIAAMVESKFAALTQLVTANRRFGSGAGQTRDCAGCGSPDHFIRQCPKIEDLIQKGLCVRGADGRITLPGGAFLPRGPEGAKLLGVQEPCKTNWTKRPQYQAWLETRFWIYILVMLSHFFYSLLQQLRISFLTEIG